ncbi:MAG: arginine--tRNA ligase [Bacteroidia bacterium]|nr:arginine--tRNA ligase [Bacteroidia bacterium]
MDAVYDIKREICQAINEVFSYEMEMEKVLLSPTKKEFDGDYTFVVFPLVKTLKKNPQEIGDTLGAYLVSHSGLFSGYNVIKGFLNLEIKAHIWIRILRESFDHRGQNETKDPRKILVEFSSPNTNKPLHLGHIRNILLGWSMYKLASANGHHVVRTQIVNDRGIAVCKSMMAWLKTADGDTPESTSTKGDFFVGNYYVKFDQLLQAEYKEWQQTDTGEKVYQAESKPDQSAEDFFKKFKNNYFNMYSHLGKETKDMLIKWEKGDEETVTLWKTMNQWVYDGFEKTYEELGVAFDQLYYESNTYLLGKKAIEEGLQKDVFYRKEDGSIWVSLEDEGMDEKILLRSDGTSVYMTQDIGTAHKRYEDHGMDSCVYVVGNEQEYHFKALFAILKKLGEPYADQLHHLSYGMVELPSGKMKSREGTVVDADDLIAEVIKEARFSAEERGGLEGLSDEERATTFRKIGLAALKYFMIKINPRKGMIFDPKESVDMQGTTGPYIQNAFVRIRSIFRKLGGQYTFSLENQYTGELTEMEKDLIQVLEQYSDLLKEAMDKYDPSLIANYAYTLAKGFHRFYHECRILNAETEETKTFRLSLSYVVADILEKAMDILGIEMPEYM